MVDFLSFAAQLYLLPLNLYGAHTHLYVFSKALLQQPSYMQMSHFQIFSARSAVIALKAQAQARARVPMPPLRTTTLA